MALFPKVIAPEGVHGRHIYSIPRLLSLERLIVCVSCAAKAQAWFSFIGRSHERNACKHFGVCATNHRMPHKTRVLILGGGFGGLYAALQFEKRRDPRFEVTVVNRENFFLFTPMLHEIAASDLDLTNIVNPVRKMIRRVHFFCGDVDKIDIDKKRVTVSHGFDRHSHELEYDHLILALGSVTNFFNLPGVAEHALTMKSLGDAIQLRNRLIAHLEEADTECARAERPPLLTFVVAGGGFAGVETIASINDFLR